MEHGNQYQYKHIFWGREEGRGGSCSQCSVLYRLAPRRLLCLEKGGKNTGPCLFELYAQMRTSHKYFHQEKRENVITCGAYIHTRHTRPKIYGFTKRHVLTQTHK